MLIYKFINKNKINNQLNKTLLTKQQEIYRSPYGYTEQVNIFPTYNEYIKKYIIFSIHLLFLFASAFESYKLYYIKLSKIKNLQGEGFEPSSTEYKWS